jgi:3-hydroxyacyl-CoA dehydrogenase
VSRPLGPPFPNLARLTRIGDGSNRMSMSANSIDRVAVLGAGIMGTGIACHMANAGLDVVLLDIPPPDGKGHRNAFAQGALKKAQKAKPSPIFHKSAFDRIQIGNIEDDLGLLSECQLVVEAVKEDLDIKRSLFERVEKVIGEETVISSNTSGIPLAQLVAGRSESFTRRFMITHFFNPVRYMKLLELVCGPQTDESVKNQMEAFAQDILGKGVVWAKDTPNFVANRVGTFAMMRCMREMEAQGLSIEEVDAIFGRPLGRPKSAVFRTGDLVGLDLLLAVTEHCHEGLPNDPQRDMYIAPDWVKQLVADGHYGSKSGSGFYRKAKKTEDNPKGLEVWDYKSGEYRAIQKVRITSLGVAKNQDDLVTRLKTVIWADDPAGKVAWPVVRDTLAYAAQLVGEIADDQFSIDNGMKWGFGWDVGPFETWDALGFEKVAARMQDEGVDLPAWVQAKRTEAATSIYAEGGTGELLAQSDAKRASLATLKARGANTVLSNSGASLIDINDGVLALEFHTKANAIDADITTMLIEAIDYAEANSAGMVIYNEGEHFSFGANLMLIFMYAQQQQWDQCEEASRTLQDAVQKIRYAKVPIIAAPHGMALGGGCEIVLAAGSGAGCRPHAELYTGLVEVGVGLIPGAGGTMNTLFGMLERIPEGAQVDITPFAAQAFQQIAMAKVSTSAEEARRLGYVPQRAMVTLDRSRQLHDAKSQALGLYNAGYRPPARRAFRLLGESGIATMNTMVQGLVQGGQATEHDALIAGKIAHVLCGGLAGHTRKMSEQDILDLEREAFVSLVGEQKSQDRISHMLMKNKPLRN